MDIAIPVHGYESHLSIDRAHGIKKRQLTTDAAQHDGSRLRVGLIDRTNTIPDVWADGAYCSVENETWLAERGMTSRIHRKRPRGRPMPRAPGRPTAASPGMRSKVEHVFAHRMVRTGLTIRTIGSARARAAVTLTNMAFNMIRCRRRDSRTASA